MKKTKWLSLLLALTLLCSLWAASAVSVGATAPAAVAREPEEPEVVELELIEVPDKIVYTSGECLDLDGLHVRVWLSNGFFDSYDGDRLEITKDPLITVGEQKIKVAYGDAMTVFWVEVVKKQEEEPEVVELELIEVPDKTVYTSGECLDLKGLHVRVWLSNGFFDSYDGDRLEITKDPLITVGEQKIKVAYQDAMTVFWVEVKPHVHSFSKWEVTTKPTCTEEGIKYRECECGHTERAGVPATGHSWDAGTVTTEPGATTEGIKTFTCSECTETKTEPIPATGEITPPDGTDPTDPATPSEPEASTEATKPTAPEGNGSSGEPQKGNSGGLVILIVAVALLVSAGIVALIVLLMKKK